jgi:hypothetical protein
MKIARYIATLVSGTAGGFFAAHMEQTYNPNGSIILYVTTLPVWFAFGSLFVSGIIGTLFVALENRRGRRWQ